MITNPLDVDASGQAALVRTGEVSPSELVAAAIRRIEADDGAINAVVIRYFDEALTRASGPLPDGPLRGVPILLKDWGAELQGAHYTAGSRVLAAAGYRSRATSFFVQRLLDAGAVILGRSHSPELALMPCSDTKAYGVTRNPWNLDYSVGGSSGGSAAAVAAGYVAVAHASDGGGSIRIPASCCGLVGLKPTRGRISRGPLKGEGWGGISIDGALSRSVRDTALFLDIMGGPGIGDPYAAPALSRPLQAEVGVAPPALRVGVWLRPPGLPNGPTPECVAAVESAAALLEELGHTVDADAYPSALDGWSRFASGPLALTGVALWAREKAAELGREEIVGELEDHCRQAVEGGRKVDGVTYLQAIDHIHALTRRIVAWWQVDGFDLLLSPVLGSPPARIGEVRAYTEAAGKLDNDRGAHYVAYPGAANITGQPAISLPLHWAGGVPVGVQLVAAPGREDLLVRVARQLEIARPWADRRPSSGWTSA